MCARSDSGKRRIGPERPAADPESRVAADRDPAPGSARPPSRGASASASTAVQYRIRVDTGPARIRRGDRESTATNCFIRCLARSPYQTRTMKTITTMIRMNGRRHMATPFPCVELRMAERETQLTNHRGFPGLDGLLGSNAVSPPSPRIPASSQRPGRSGAPRLSQVRASR